MDVKFDTINPIFLNHILSRVHEIGMHNMLVTITICGLINEFVTEMYILL